MKSKMEMLLVWLYTQDQSNWVWISNDSN